MNVASVHAEVILFPNLILVVCARIQWHIGFLKIRQRYKRNWNHGKCGRMFVAFQEGAQCRVVDLKQEKSQFFPNLLYISLH